MHPVLVNLGPIPVHTYGFLIAMGFLVGISVAKRLAVQAKLNVEKILDLCFWVLLSGFLGARILFIITRADYFFSNPIEIFKIWEGGLVFLGGLFTVLPFMLWFAHKNKLSLWKTLDVMTPALVIVHAFGRLGCLAAGCCYGKPTGTSFGVRLYSDLVDRQYQGIPLHPTQLYESFSLFLLFCGLIYTFKKKSFDGQVTLTYLLAYSVIRSIIEVFRGDLIRGFVIDDVLSTSQFLSILIFIAAFIVLVFRLKQVHGKTMSRMSPKSAHQKR